MSAEETYKLALSKNDFVAELYNRYGKKLYAYAVHTWNTEEDVAWELIYKTLYRTMETYSKYTFDNEKKFASFLFRIFINYLRNHWRDHKRGEGSIPMAETDPEQLANVQEPPPREERADPRLDKLRQALDGMEDWQRMLLLMRSEGRPYAEIAGYVNKPEDQLKVYYQRLKQQISTTINERS